MGFLDELKKLTQPYEEVDDIYEGADEAYRAEATSDAGLEFENTYGYADETIQYEEEEAQVQAEAQPQISNPFAGIKVRRQKPAQQESFPAPAEVAGGSLNLVVFNPKTVEESSGIVFHLRAGKSVLVNLDSAVGEQPRRILDFISGVSFALNCKIKTLNTRTYLVTLPNVNVGDA